MHCPECNSVLELHEYAGDQYSSRDNRYNLIQSHLNRWGLDKAAKKARPLCSRQAFIEVRDNWYFSPRYRLPFIFDGQIMTVAYYNDKLHIYDGDYRNGKELDFPIRALPINEDFDREWNKLRA